MVRGHIAEQSSNIRRSKLWETLKGPFKAIQRRGRKEKGTEMGKKKKRGEFVCVEETIDKREHMCMCERTRWEST